jgi:hypothetical protein
MTEQAQPQTQEQPQVTIADLTMAVRVIDLATERGGFRGPELSTVGAVRDRIARFVDAVQAQQQAPVDPSAQQTPATE